MGNMCRQAGILVICSLTALANWWAESGDVISKDGDPDGLPGYGIENGKSIGHKGCFDYSDQFITISYSVGTYSNGNADLELALLQQGSDK